MQHYDEPGIVNIGVGYDISILDLANLIRGIVGFDGELLFDASKPDGTPRKLVDVTKITELGWRAEIELSDGIAATYAWYREALRDGPANSPRCRAPPTQVGRAPNAIPCKGPCVAMCPEIRGLRAVIANIVTVFSCAPR